MKNIKEILSIKQVAIETDYPRITIRNSVDVIDLAIKEIGDDVSEVLLLIILNTKNEVISFHKVFRGGISHITCSNREIFQSVLLENGASFILAHNHPSGNLTPSESDCKMTEKLITASQFIGIKFLDHVIVSRTKGISMSEIGAVYF